MRPSDEAQSSARNRKSKRVRDRSIACTQCAQIGETENVPQQDTVNATESTSHSAATVHGETTVRHHPSSQERCARDTKTCQSHGRYMTRANGK